MEIWELVAREQVRDCIAAYNAHGDAGRISQMVAVFAEDGVMEIEGVPTRGRAAIESEMVAAGREFVAYAKAAQLPRNAALLRHSTSTIQIAVDSPMIAHASMYYTVLMPHGLDHWGRYVDDYECVGDRWLISRRQEWTDGTVAGGFGERALARRELGEVAGAVPEVTDH